MKEDQDQVHMREINRLRDKWIEKVVEYVEAGEAVPENFIDFQWALQLVDRLISCGHDTTR